MSTLLHAMAATWGWSRPCAGTEKWSKSLKSIQGNWVGQGNRSGELGGRTSWVWNGIIKAFAMCLSKTACFTALGNGCHQRQGHCTTISNKIVLGRKLIGRSNVWLWFFSRIKTTESKEQYKLAAFDQFLCRLSNHHRHWALQLIFVLIPLLLI